MGKSLSLYLRLPLALAVEPPEPEDGEKPFPLSPPTSYYSYLWLLPSKN